MKNRLSLLTVIGLLFGLAALGCSSISVHVDLYSKSSDEVETKPGKIDRARKTLLGINKLGGGLNDLFEKHRNYWNLVISNLNSPEFLKNEELTKAGIENDIVVANEQIVNSRNYQKELNISLNNLQQWLKLGIKNLEDSIQEGNLLKRLELEQQAEDNLLSVAIGIQVLRDKVKFEFGESNGDPDRQRNLAGLGPKTSMGSIILKNATMLGKVNEEKKSIVTAKNTLTNSLDQSKRNLLMQPTTTNPDLLVDDGDIFLRHIESGEYGRRGHWKEDFYLQEAEAGGNASYLIVRQTPTRYTLHQAKSDPKPF